MPGFELTEELIQRRAAGEPLRKLAADAGTNHMTLSRAFRHPDVALLLAELRSAPLPQRAKPKQARWRR